jgi:hypothetical protein
VDGALNYFYFSCAGHWSISGDEDMRAGSSGSRVTSATAEAGALTPEQVRGGWQVAIDGRMVAAPNVHVRQWPAEERRVMAEEARQQEEEARRHAVRTGSLIVEGQRAGEPCAEYMGTFELVTARGAEPPLAVNRRPVYRYRAASGDWYFYYVSNRYWAIGNERDMRGEFGVFVASVVVEPDALTPDQVTGGWRVVDTIRNTGKLQPAPNLRVRQKQGRLLSRKGTIFPYNWSDRRFVLTDRGLERFDPKSGASKGCIVFASAMCSVRNADEENAFIVVCGDQEMKLKAASGADRAVWVADIKRRIEKPEREARVRAEREARRAKAAAAANAAAAEKAAAEVDAAVLRAGARASLALRRRQHAAAEAAVVADAETWQAAVVVKQTAEADAKQAQNWSAAKEAKGEKEALTKQAAAAAVQRQRDVAAAAARVSEGEEWERLLEVKANDIEASKRPKAAEIEARKEVLLQKEDYAGLEAADAELAQSAQKAAAGLASVKQALAWLQMPAEEAAGYAEAAPCSAEPCKTAAKFTAGRTMIVGQPVTAARGIWPALGVKQGGARFVAITSDGVGEITREFTTLGAHCDEHDRARFDYIFNQRASLLDQGSGAKRDVGNEGMTLRDFARKGAELAGLTKAHVLALRLYTSNSYWRINNPMRGVCTEANPHPYAATTYYIHDGIMKLRATRAGDATAVRTFWRGMSDMGVTDEFLEQGGTEMACMSTTEYLAVARAFAGVGEVANPLLLKVQSTSLMDCGADIKWLSMYPGEAEVLFPPLTYLLPIGEPVVEDGCTVITVQPRF